MPFEKAQELTHKVLPDKQYGVLYKIASKIYKVCSFVCDRTLFILPLLFSLIKRDWHSVNKILIIQSALPYTMTSKIGVLMTYNLAYNTIFHGVKGDFVECGVARGGCALTLARVASLDNPARKTWLFDSFEGLPPQTDKDGVIPKVKHNKREKCELAEGYCLGTYEEVKHLLFDKHKLSKDNVLMVKGWFDETLPKYRHDIGDIAVLRLDGDWFESTKCCLENLYDNVVKGGFVIIDDYTLTGCKKAVDEFIANHNIKVGFMQDENGRAYLVK